jgi:hypothetical protein
MTILLIVMTNTDRLWKIRRIFDMLNEEYSKYYTASEHLAVDKVIHGVSRFR